MRVLRHERMRPDQIRAAIAAGTPAVPAIGVPDCHGEHLPLGMDLLAVTRILARIEAERSEASFSGLLGVGFRNIHGVVHHQTEGFAQGMPTDLAFRLAGRQAVMRHLEATRGAGWWGADPGAS